MKTRSLFLLLVVALSALQTKAQCLANFTWFASGNTVAFTNTSSGSSSANYSWSFGDNQYDYQTSPSHSYANAGSYLVCLTMYDSLSNCQASHCDTITVTSSASCAANFTWVANGNTVTFTNTSTGAINPIYMWSFGDNQYGYQTNEIHTYASNGTYLVCLTLYDSLSNCQSSHCDTITISQSSNCVANFTFTLSGNIVTFTNTSTGSLSPNYYWSFGDNTYSNQTNPTHTYTSAGAYVICLTLYDSLSNCQSTHCDSLSILIGVEEYTAAKVSVYPNPANNNLFLQSSANLQGQTIRIIDLQGRVLKTEKLNSNVISIADLASGVYFLQLEDQRGALSTSRFIKE